MKRQLLSAAICAAITAHSPLSFAQSDDSGDKKGVETLDRINREDGLTMLVVEQNANLALGIADRGFVLETGAIVARGTAAELQGDDAVRKAYLGL